VGKTGKIKNHAYQYKYIIKNKMKTTYMSKGDNKVYHRGSNDWSYEVKNKKIFQQNGKSKVTSRHVQKVQTNAISKKK
jgi:hypothetical protein